MVDVAASRASGTYERRKAPSACLVCRKRKTKCDNELPACGFCRATGGDCHYSQPKERLFDQASIAILQRLDHLEKNLGDLINGTPHASDEVSLEGVDGHGEAAHPRQALQSLPDTDAPAEFPPSSATLLRASSDMSIEALLRLPTFKQHLPLTTDNSPSQQMEKPVFTEPLPRDCDLDLRPQVMLGIVENFIENNLGCNPIVEPQALRLKAQLVAEQGLAFNGDSCLVVCSRWLHVNRAR